MFFGSQTEALLGNLSGFQFPVTAVIISPGKFSPQRKITKLLNNGKLLFARRQMLMSSRQYLPVEMK